MTEAHMILWAKTAESGDIHPLYCHMMDTAEVALAMWQLALSPGQKALTAARLGTDVDSAGRLLAFWAGLHDIGKAGPAFQCRCERVQQQLMAAGLPFRNPALYSQEFHGLVTAWALEPLLADAGMEPEQAGIIARALGGHHGIWPDDLAMDKPSRLANLGGTPWDAVRRSLHELLASHLNPGPVALPRATAHLNAFLAEFSGLVSTADWIASMEDRFPYAGALITPDEYRDGSRAQALRAVAELGWSGWQADGSSMDFDQVFRFPANAMQTAVLAEAAEIPLPALAIVESPTGGGKTEAAFALADCWLQRSNGRGLYFAMPSQATSNQMFTRVAHTYLARRYPGFKINLHLAHGQALLCSDMGRMILRESQDDKEGGVAAYSWFLPRKRTLLAPFGVGTVDQAFLSVLQAKHFFVRLFGLAHKVVVFDEVHAYDTYMNEVFCLLLRWLRAVDASVILLSATLPKQTRARLLQAYSGTEAGSGGESPYPRLTVASSGQVGSAALPKEAGRVVQLETVDADPIALVAWLRQRLTAGGNAAVVCNTVRRAQEVFLAIREAGLCPPKHCRLLHARFPFYRRHQLEEQVKVLYGKGPAYPSGPNKRRPDCSVLVATQVIEQSLDLDFDVMVTDLAPVDLLIQRAGRLHRHPNHRRPAGLEKATLDICQPGGQDDEGALELGGSRYVYEPWLLLRTWAVLNGRQAFHLPEDTDELIEQVYGGGPLTCSQSLRVQMDNAQDELDRHDTKARREAMVRLAPPPEREDLLNMANDALADDENPAVHKDIQALTRLAPPGYPLVCLHRLSDGSLNTRPDGRGQLVEPTTPPDFADLRDLLRCAVAVQLPAIGDELAQLPKPVGWRKAGALRHHRLAVFEGGVCRLENSPWILLLDDAMGLSYRKEVQ